MSIGEWDWDSTRLAATDREPPLIESLADGSPTCCATTWATGSPSVSCPGSDPPRVYPRRLHTDSWVTRGLDAVCEWLIDPVVRELARAGQFSPRRAPRSSTTSGGDQRRVGTFWPAPTTH